MKVLLLIASIILTLSDVVAQDVPPPVPMPSIGGGITRKCKSPRKEAKRLARIAREGGLVTKAASGRCIRFVNIQKLVPYSVIEETTALIEREMHLNYEIVEGEPDRHYFPDEKAAVVITIIASNNEPSILVAPENAWAVVNVSAISKDNPKSDVLAARTIKEIWRAFAIAMGASNSPYQPCLMRQIFKPSDLDDNPMLSPSPFPFNAMQDTAKALKIGEKTTTTYFKACQAGWAPAPTNEVQQAIWDEVHTIPKKPMKIEFDQKKGR